VPADPPRSDRPDRFFGDVLTFGWVLPASIAVGAGLGWLADRLFGIFPVLTIALGLLGAVAGLRQIYREAETISRDVGSGGGPKEPGP
jgi:F0F1-type ATP synthase assembly protein I